MSLLYVSTVALGTLLNAATLGLSIAAASGSWQTYAEWTDFGVDGQSVVVYNLGLMSFSQQSGWGAIVNGISMDKFPAYWSPFRASAATLYLGFCFAVIAFALGALQLFNWIPALGTRAVVLYCTVLAFCSCLCGSAIGCYYMTAFRGDGLPAPKASNQSYTGFAWMYGYGCAIACPVLSFVNIFVVCLAGSAASSTIPDPQDSAEGPGGFAVDHTKPVPMADLGTASPQKPSGPALTGVAPGPSGLVIRE